MKHTWTGIERKSFWLKMCDAWSKAAAAIGPVEQATTNHDPSGKA